MEILQRPVLTTILFGLICGLSFIPLDLALNMVFLGSNALCLTLWLFAAGYAFFLCRWSQRKLKSIAFPIILLFLTIFLVKSMAAFFLMALAIISFIRSGVCFQQHGGIKLVVESLLWVVGAALVTVFTPESVGAWAPGIWMFFLLQALYFVIFDSSAVAHEKKYEIEIDPFEQASRRAEYILSNSRHV